MGGDLNLIILPVCSCFEMWNPNQNQNEFRAWKAFFFTSYCKSFTYWFFLTAFLKRVRFATSVMFSLSIGVELMTPAFPHCFLLLASVANIAKQISLACYLATGVRFCPQNGSVTSMFCWLLPFFSELDGLKWPSFSYRYCCNQKVCICYVLRLLL